MLFLRVWLIIQVKWFSCDFKWSKCVVVSEVVELQFLFFLHLVGQLFLIRATVNRAKISYMVSEPLTSNMKSLLIEHLKLFDSEKSINLKNLRNCMFLLLRLTELKRGILQFWETEFVWKGILFHWFRFFDLYTEMFLSACKSLLLKFFISPIVRTWCEWLSLSEPLCSNL